MSELGNHAAQADDLMLALRRLRRLVSQRDRLPFDSRERFVLDDEIDRTQRDAWRLASAWEVGSESTSPRDGVVSSGSTASRDGHGGREDGSRREDGSTNS